MTVVCCSLPFLVSTQYNNKDSGVSVVLAELSWVRDCQCQYGQHSHSSTTGQYNVTELKLYTTQICTYATPQYYPSDSLSPFMHGLALT